MNILEKIVRNKKQEVAKSKENKSISQLKNSSYFLREVPSFVSHILADNSTGIIAEFKRKSPSKGEIHSKASVKKIVPQYEDAGVAGISILTDEFYFGGTLADLVQGRELCSLPIIRKEFIIDPYQIFEAKAMGASAILLIGAILTKDKTLEFAQLANELGMEVLFEIHDEEEIEQLNNFIQLVGINNRNLKTFDVDLEQSIRLASQLPSSMVPIAESGISSVEDYFTLKDAGFKGFLMGEYFMKNEEPGLTCSEFVEKIRQKK